ncbi:hypothetical protein R5M74_02410 [Aeromonas hydrophila]|nr:hypothetical protein R5M74_02410 [Aeromonas hydrophila]
MKNIVLLMASLALSACTQNSGIDVNVKPFVVKAGASTPLDMRKWEEKRSGLLPVRNGDMLSAKIYNTFPVPVTISRFEFPATESATCAIKSNTQIVVQPYTITDIDLIGVYTLAECHPDFGTNQGARFIGIPSNHDYAKSINTTGVMLKFVEKVYKTTSTASMSYPLLFDIHGMYE